MVPWSARMPLFEIYEDPEKGMTVRRGTAASNDIDMAATGAGTFWKHLTPIPHFANAKHRSIPQIITTESTSTRHYSRHCPT